MTKHTPYGGRIMPGPEVAVTTSEIAETSAGFDLGVRVTHVMQLGKLAPMRRGETTILFVAANPVTTPQIQLDEEARGIAQELRMSTGRDAFRLQSLWAARPMDLLRGIDQYAPQIIHF